MNDLALPLDHERPQLPAAPVSEAASLMDVISRAAADPNTDMMKLEKLLDLYERIDAKRAEQAYHEAMSAAQAEMRPIATDASNPQTKSKYASYHALDQALRPVYSKHGFSLSFSTAEGAPADHVRVICQVSHRQGHSERHQLDMPADGKGAKGGDVMTKTHATGAAMSYGQRYLLRGVFNISVFADDDGNGASGGATLTTPQIARINALADEVGADKRRFCEHMNVGSIAEIPQRQFGRAIQALEAKRQAAKR